MLLTLLYHRVSDKKDVKNSIKLIEKHFKYISKNFLVVTPGDKIKKGKINICITFDDAYYDFYHFVFPLLKKYKIPCVLAVPTKYIKDKDNRLSHERLNDNSYCIWQEIIEMQKSNLVKIASHSHSHENLIETKDILKEITHSKKILEEKLSSPITTFAYPYGKFNKNVHKEVRKHYQHIMRIGSAINFSWNNFSNLIYRIVADNQPAPFSFNRFPNYLFRYIVNSIRKR